MAPKTIILVIGCHRSGTSAITGSLARMGAKLPEDLIPPARDNPKGFHESRRVVALHDRLLADLGASWDRPVPSVVRLDTKPWNRAKAKIASILRDLPGPVCAVKDPRASLFVHLWKEVCEREGVRLVVIEVRRNTAAVIASLCARQGWDELRAARVVRQYAEQIEAARLNFDPERWATVDFPSDLEGAGTWVMIAGKLDLALALTTVSLAGFYDPTLVHHRAIRANGKPRRWAVVVPSRSDSNICDFVDNVMDLHPEIEPSQIVVVSDGLPLRTRWSLRGVNWVSGRRPFVFSEAINAGAKAAGTADLLIAGDDVRFTAARTIDRLAERSKGMAALSPEIQGVCGQPAQRMGSAMTTASWLAFICAYIPRRAWEAVGPLDERFTGYGYDDVDWSLRSRGYGPLRIDHSLRVVHADCSTYRSLPNWDALYAANQALFEQKWKPSLTTGRTRVE